MRGPQARGGRPEKSGRSQARRGGRRQSVPPSAARRRVPARGRQSRQRPALPAYAGVRLTMTPGPRQYAAGTSAGARPDGCRCHADRPPGRQARASHGLGRGSGRWPAPVGKTGRARRRRLRPRQGRALCVQDQPAGQPDMVEGKRRCAGLRSSPSCAVKLGKGQVYLADSHVLSRLLPSGRSGCGQPVAKRARRAALGLPARGTFFRKGGQGGGRSFSQVRG